MKLFTRSQTSTEQQSHIIQGMASLVHTGIKVKHMLVKGPQDNTGKDKT